MNARRGCIGSAPGKENKSGNADDASSPSHNTHSRNFWNIALERIRRTEENAENESESEFTTVENSAPSDNTYGSIGINFNIPISKIHHENNKNRK